MNTKTHTPGSAGERLSNERAELLGKAQNLAETIKAENRESTGEEIAKSREWFRRIEQIDDQLAAAKADEELIQRLARASAGTTGPGDRDRYSAVGYDHDAVKAGLSAALRQKGAYAYTMPLVKEAVTAGSLNLPASGTSVSDTPPGDTVVALRDLFTRQEAAGALVRYYQLGAGSGADIVAEGGLKPELEADITPVDAELSKIAVRFTYTDELGEDAEFLVSYIGREATRAVLRRENQLVIDTLDNVTGALTSTGSKADAVDVLAGAIGAAQATNGLTPTRIVANPLDIAEIRTLKASGSGEYAVDPLSTAPAQVHGVPLVPTPVVAPGTMYLTTPGLGVFYTRGALRVETGYAQGDWEHNRVTTRVEERVLPAVVRGTLLTRITLTDE